MMIQLPTEQAMIIDHHSELMLVEIPDSLDYFE